MLATRRQIEYLQTLTDRAWYLKNVHPALIPDGIYHVKWGMDMTSEKAGARIQYMRSIVEAANNILFPKRKTSTDDLPE